ncbi:hypothetical protein HPB50_015207 [Hyalomma asiaticum]|uniref:Uncharacterized protein n=1 Tax=Hyalomma asiaticum TaxID=266040 RepID=A0ACB7ST30_HYAAI|nr:hypothetical protein HPB50_015207 [Hyalomma asiaticum]
MIKWRGLGIGIGGGSFRGFLLRRRRSAKEGAAAAADPGGALASSRGHHPQQPPVRCATMSSIGSVGRNGGLLNGGLLPANGGVKKDNSAPAMASANGGTANGPLLETTTVKKGLLWQQWDKFFSRWKERYFVLTKDYLACFKKESKSVLEQLPRLPAAAAAIGQGRRGGGGRSRRCAGFLARPPPAAAARVKKDNSAPAMASANGGTANGPLLETTTVKKGLLWQQWDKFFSRWKERYFVLTKDYLACFKKESKVNLADVEGLQWADKKRTGVIALRVGTEGQLLLWTNCGLDDWMFALRDAIGRSKGRREALRKAHTLGPQFYEAGLTKSHLYTSPW